MEITIKGTAEEVAEMLEAAKKITRDEERKKERLQRILGAEFTEDDAQKESS